MEATSSAPAVPTTLRTLPDVAEYTSLADHQSHTPASFFDGPPVLHFHATGARVYLPRDQRAKVPWGESAEAEASSLALSLGDVVQHRVDVFVGSNTLKLYCPSAACGVALPYPTIILHAIQSATAADGHRVPTLFMQLMLGGDSGDEADETVELYVALEGANTESDPGSSSSPVSQLYEAVSACADLHPDKAGDDDDDGDAYPRFFSNDDDDDDDDEDGTGLVFENGVLEPVEGFQGVFRGADNAVTTAETSSDLPPPMPGSSGWITAENAHEFFDADGNWLGRDGNGPLGEGAGRVRGRDEAEEEKETTEGEKETSDTAAAAETNGTVNGESKRLRTE